MNEIYEITNEVWKFTKWMYRLEGTTHAEWTAIGQKSNELVQKYAGDKLKHELVKKMLLAVIDYYEAEVRATKEFKE